MQLELPQPCIHLHCRTTTKPHPFLTSKFISEEVAQGLNGSLIKDHMGSAFVHGHHSVHYCTPTLVHEVYHMYRFSLRSYVKKPMYPVGTAVREREGGKKFDL